CASPLYYYAMDYW
nr:immunoglobulin heavy chain junction region [Mus musculus]